MRWAIVVPPPMLNGDECDHVHSNIAEVTTYRIYARQSLDRTGEGLAVARQIADCDKLGKQRGWTAAGEPLVDNDTSASTAKPRPAFTRLLELVDAHAVDVVIVWAVDRLVRRLADLEDLIGHFERAGVRLVTVSGDIDLSTDQGRLIARILASVARGEVERKGARQKRANLQAAEAGKPPSGPVPFGFEPDRVTHNAERAAAVRDAYTELLAGGTLAGIARTWNGLGLLSGKVRTGRKDTGEPSQWCAATVRALLLNPRNAALRAHHGEIVGPATWEPIVSEVTWRAAVGLLRDPARKHAPPTPRNLLSGIALCGLCGNYVVAGAAYHHGHTYRCGQNGVGHVARRGDHVDEWIGELVVARMRRPDAADLLTPPKNGPDLPALHRERATRRLRLIQTAKDHDDDLITRAQFLDSTARHRARIAEIEAAITEAGRVDVLADLIGVDDVAATWEGYSAERKRPVVDTLMSITLHSPGKGARIFNPDTVEVTPKR
jgi:DNA invertase Pin-like site-specific DNA recombinase